MRAAPRLVALMCVLAILPVPTRAQAPSSPSPASPPSGTITQAPPPGSPAASTPAPSPAPTVGLPTLVPDVGDPVNVDEVTLPEKPVLIVSGTSGWDDGLKSLRASFARIQAELDKLGVRAAGRPLALFTQTTDDTFTYDAMIPITAAPTGAPALPAEMRFGVTPSGKAYRFVHKGPYDDVDTTYETITTYLDAKDILAKDTFIEEYVNDVSDPADGELEVNIFVQPK